ncbi:MAG: MutS-related protein, partial [Bacillota bacterium]
VALITLLAHIGSFVPAKSADICITDRIFTRVGASDNLVHGQSTFMVEMLEVANIINNATPNSLLILDEIGRGTSTLDGLSIAWAIIEYIALKIKAKSLFATHYHELSEIENLLDGIRNYKILVHESKKQIAFIYKIARGSANKSYGIEVAELAGIQKDITKRATDIMNVLSKTHQLSGNLQEKLSSQPSDTTVAGGQIGFFEEDENIKEIKMILSDLDINRCSPIESLTILSDLKKLIRKVK